MAKRFVVMADIVMDARGWTIRSPSPVNEWPCEGGFLRTEQSVSPDWSA
jgi:hypothetical protein